MTWHEHQGLCGANYGTTSAFFIDMYPAGDPTTATAADEALCLSGGIFPCGVGGCYFFYTYGWMMHLYNFIPNPEGRFMLWNSNVP